jgi:hypothetical protein
MLPLQKSRQIPPAVFVWLCIAFTVAFWTVVILLST